MNIDINMREIIRVLIGVESYTVDLRELTLKKITKERLCTHVRRFYVYRAYFRPNFLEIKLFMDVTDGNHNIFYSGAGSLILDSINSGLANIQDMYMFKKLNTKPF